MQHHCTGNDRCIYLLIARVPPEDQGLIVLVLYGQLAKKSCNKETTQYGVKIDD